MCPSDTNKHPPRPACIPVVLLLLHGVLGVGCALHKTETAPRPDVPVPAFSTQSEASVASSKGSPWWSTFGSTRLEGYVEHALASSRTLEAAKARFEQADAVYRRSAASLWPSVDLKAHQEQDLKTENPRGEYRDLGVVAAWELDLFGRLGSVRLTRGMERESRARLLEAARLSLSASVTEAYLGVVEQVQLLKLLQSQRSSALEYLKIIQERFDQGLISKVDLLQQQSQVADLQSLIPDAEANLRVQQNVLSSLEGGRPTEGARFDFDDALPESAPLIGVGNPNELLLNRPDLLAARADLMAADADIGRSIADRLPRLTLTADYFLVDGRGREGALSTFVPSLLMPLVDWGNRRAEVARTKAVFKERLALFAQAYLDAVLEVENAVVRESKQRELIQKLVERSELLNAALLQTRERYQNGLTDYLPVLTSLQQLNAVEQRLIRERRRLLSFRVTLFKALGGPMPAFEMPRDGAR